MLASRLKVLLHVRRKQEQENQIDRSSVDSVIIYWSVEPNKQAVEAIEPADLGMWDSDTGPYAC
jgi:hypothetical protein